MATAFELDTTGREIGVKLQSFEIRRETEQDVEGIRAVNLEAFRDHPISRQTEHLIVDALREAGALESSLVAVSEGHVLGHVAVSKAQVGEDSSGWFLLGPLAVLPNYQRQGFGSALVEAALGHLRSTGARGCVLVGDPAYYGRFGFRPLPGLLHEGVPDQFVLAVPFSNIAPSGKILAHHAFSIE